MIKHVISSGETYESISLKYFQNVNKATLLRQVNPDLNSVILKEGEIMLIPYQPKIEINNSNNVFSLVIKGREIYYFENLIIDTAYDSFSIGGSFNVPNASEMRKLFVPFEYEQIKFSIKGETIVNGKVFNIVPVDTHTIQIHFYTTSHSLETINKLYKNTSVKSNNQYYGSMKEICEDLMTPYGVEYKASDEAKEQFNDKFGGGVKYDKRSKISTFIVSSSHRRRLIVRTDFETGGIIFDIPSNIQETLTLSEKKIFESFKAKYNGDLLFRIIETTQSYTSRNKTVVIPAQVVNKWVKDHRTYSDNVSIDERESLQILAENINKGHKRKVFSVNFNYPTIFDSKGKIIKVGDVVALKNEEYYINQEVKFLIVKCRYLGATQSCVIEAVPLSVITGGEMQEYWL